MVLPKKKIAAEPASKTARASLAKKLKEEPFKASGELDRIVPLCGSEYAYIRDPREDRLIHLKVGSEWWNTVIEELLETEHGPRIERELEALGWKMMNCSNS